MQLSLFTFLTLSCLLISITALVTAVTYYRDKVKALEKTIATHKEKAAARKASLEGIEDVFADLKTAGISFVRLDAQDIFFRSPRG